MRLSTRLKLLGEFLGFLLISTGGTFVAIGILLLLSRIGMGQSAPGLTVGWWPLFAGSEVSGIAMLAGGIFLVRRLTPRK